MYIVILLLLLLLFWYYSEFNTKNIGNFKVHNQFDTKSSKAVFSEINRRIIVLQDYMKKKYIQSSQPYAVMEMDKRTEQFIKNYNPNNLYEISPNNILGNTSFTEGKGKKVVFCLRDKSGKLHDINTLMFVALHEMTHIMNDRWGHEEYFWTLFRIVLIDAEESGIYEPVNYSKFPKNYCGMQITQNPYF